MFTYIRRTGIIALFVFSFSWSMAGAAVQTEAVDYKDGDVELQGYLAYDDTLAGPRPGILVVHEWKGLGEYAKMRAQMIAELGYVAFAADMYGKGIYAETHEEAAALSGVYHGDRKRMRARGEAALNVLTSQSRVDPGRIAAIGYCFGGTTVLELARGGYDLKGVVSFHGGLSTPMPAEPGAVKARILVMHGADDSHVTPSVEAFKEEMQRAGADWKFYSFEGAVHSFTVKSAGDDPSKGIAYNETADKTSWKLMKQFFGDIF